MSVARPAGRHAVPLLAPERHGVPHLKDRVLRVILVGAEHERDAVRWRLEGTGVIVVGEFATLTGARESGVEAEAFMIASADAAVDVDGRVEPDTVSPALESHQGDRSTAVIDDVERLTPRELEVIELLAEGLPNKAIATELGISDQTVKFHVAQITGKLGVANRTEAVRRAIRLGILTV